MVWWAGLDVQFTCAILSTNGVVYHNYYVPNRYFLIAQAIRFRLSLPRKAVK